MQAEILRLYVQKKGQEPSAEVKEFIESLTVREVAKIWSLMGDGGDFIESLQRVIAVKISKAGGTQLGEGASLEDLVKALKEEKERKKKEEEEIKRKAKEAEKERQEQEARLKAEKEAAEKAAKEAEEAAKQAAIEQKKAEEAAKAKAETEAKRAAQEKAAADAAAAASAAAAGAAADRQAAEAAAEQARKELEALEAEMLAAEAAEKEATERASKHAAEAQKRDEEKAASEAKAAKEAEEAVRLAAGRRDVEAAAAALEEKQKREEEETKKAEEALKSETIKVTLQTATEALGLDCLAGAGRVRIIEVSGACQRAGVKSASVLLKVDGQDVDSQETLIESVQKIRGSGKLEFEIVCILFIASIIREVQPPIHISEEDKEILKQYNAQKDEILWWANKVESGKNLKIAMRIMRALDLMNKGTKEVFCEVKLRECTVDQQGYIVVGQGHANPQKQTTKTLKSEKNKETKRLILTEWQEDFVFDVPKNDCIRVSIFGKKAIGKEYLGKVDLVMPELMAQLCQGAFAGRWPVQGQEEGRGPVAGDIEIELSLIAVDGNDGSGPDGPGAQ